MLGDDRVRFDAARRGMVGKRVGWGWPRRRLMDLSGGCGGMVIVC